MSWRHDTPARSRSTTTGGDDQTLEYGYNNDNRLIWVKCDGTEIARYDYFAGGQLKSTLRQGTIRTLNEYDQAQRLVRQTTTDAGGKVICDLGRHYDNDGLVDGEILHHLGASWTHVYDNAGRLTDSTLAGNGGGPPPFTNPYVNEPPTPIVSADSNEASAAPAALTAVPNYAGHWNYDAAGNITSFTENGATWTRTHNSRSQMLTETLSGSTEHYDYTYDPQGNQTKEEFTPAGWATPKEIKTRGYGAFNEIGTFVLQTRSTDGGQLTNVTSYQYYYRPDGVRWGKEDLLASTNQCEWFVSVSSNILTEYRQSVGQGYELKAANVPGLGIDEHIARVDVLDGNSIALYLNNAIGSTHQMVRSTGTVLNQDMTTPWGKNLPGYSWTDAVPNRYGLTGQERDRETATASDATGEMHYRARGYSPRQMRFLQNDPIFGNRPTEHYVYVGNMPVSGSDPTGQQEPEDEDRDTQFAAGFSFTLGFGGDDITLRFDAVLAWRKRLAERTVGEIDVGVSVYNGGLGSRHDSSVAGDAFAIASVTRGGGEGDAMPKRLYEDVKSPFSDENEHDLTYSTGAIYNSETGAQPAYGVAGRYRGVGATWANDGPLHPAVLFTGPTDKGHTGSLNVDVELAKPRAFSKDLDEPLIGSVGVNVFTESPRQGDPALNASELTVSLGTETVQAGASIGLGALPQDTFHDALNAAGKAIGVGPVARYFQYPPAEGVRGFARYTLRHGPDEDE